MKMAKQEDIPFVFILSWNRPLYLWACLDSLYRHTEHPCKIVIADNNSTDPLVRQVISNFDKRELFHRVHMYDENDHLRFKKLIDEYWDEIGSYFVFVESDIEILPTKDQCWLSTFIGHMTENENLASVGSRVYKKDFVSMEEAKRLLPDADEKELEFLIKAEAPMRGYQHTDEKLIEPHNAPLRLLMMRKKAYARIEFGQDFQMYNRLKMLGYDAKISTEVVHRHLSLLNIYDYCSYSLAERNNFFDLQLL